MSDEEAKENEVTELKKTIKSDMERAATEIQSVISYCSFKGHNKPFSVGDE